MNYLLDLRLNSEIWSKKTSDTYSINYEWQNFMLSAKSIKCHKSAQFPLILFLYLVMGRETLLTLSLAHAPHNTG